MSKEHKWEYCTHCEKWMVVCKNCGNNSCNGGTGKKCSDNCKEANELMKKGLPKIIIAGGRDFTDWDYLVDSINSTGPPIPFEIVSGGARGADSLGELYGTENGYPIKMFPADWKTYGYSAGPIRNEEMANYADGLIAFWDGVSKGTAHMIKIAKAKNLEVKVFNYVKKIS